MSRPLDGWPALGAVLARVLASDAPTWIAADTRHAAEVLLRRLRRDALRAIGDATTREAPALLGVARSGLLRARAAGGWLSAEEPPP